MDKFGTEGAGSINADNINNDIIHQGSGAEDISKNGENAGSIGNDIHYIDDKVQEAAAEESVQPDAEAGDGGYNSSGLGESAYEAAGERDDIVSYAQYNDKTAGAEEANFIVQSGHAGDDSSKDDPKRTPVFYTESYKKSAPKRGASLMQLILVAVVSSILGGVVVGAIFMFISPGLQPIVKEYFGQPSQEQAAVSGNNGIYKKVEIEKTDSAVTAIAEKVSPSIVGIRVVGAGQDIFGFNTLQGTSEGSGIIIKSDGYIMTNNHVITNALESGGNTQTRGSKIEVILPDQKDKPYTAQVVGRDQRTDLAVLKIDAANLPAAELGDSDDIRVGELAVAIGNPGGLEFMSSVTAGVISGIDRSITDDSSDELKLIQTDASINPGNSGGALVNSSGQVIGINSVKIATQGFEGLGFAIPINKAKEVTDNLIEYKYVKGRPYLGIWSNADYDEATAKQLNLPVGVLVDKVEPLSGSYDAGIQRGDIITRFGGREIKNLDQLNEEKNKYKPGDKVTMSIYRQGETINIDIVLSEQKN